MSNHNKQLTLLSNIVKTWTGINALVPLSITIMVVVLMGPKQVLGYLRSSFDIS